MVFDNAKLCWEQQDFLEAIALETWAQIHWLRHIWSRNIALQENVSELQHQ